MTTLLEAVWHIRSSQIPTGKPLAIILAGHNGSGKSTMWRRHLSDVFKIPLINADRMMLSILPEPNTEGLPTWATVLRDTDHGWMRVAQLGVQAFVGHAMRSNVSFAMETVFSHWEERADGTIDSKIDLIRNMQAEGYFVLLFFVGLQNADLSVFRVRTRVIEGGHDVEELTLRRRFPKTRKAIAAAALVADATIMVDNSRDQAHAFTVCLVQAGAEKLYDIRTTQTPPRAIADWMAAVSP